MNYKSFVFALMLVLISANCIYAQNKGKQTKKAVEAAVTKKVSGAAKAAKAPRVTPSTALKAPAAPRVTGVKAVSATAAAKSAQQASALNAAKLAKGMKPASQKAGTLTVSVAVITRGNTIQFLTQQAERERQKAVENSHPGQELIWGDSTGDYWTDTHEPYIEATQQDYEEYAQAVRELLRPAQEQIHNKEFLQEEFGGKTYTSTLELAEDIAMDNLRGLDAPPCFYRTEKTDDNPFRSKTDGGIGYVLELPADGMVLKKADGTEQVLDPKTQIIFYAPLSYIGPGKYAQIIKKADLENPKKYYWLSPRPDKKFNRAMVNVGIPNDFGLTKEEKEAEDEFYRKLLNDPDFEKEFEKKVLEEFEKKK